MNLKQPPSGLIEQPRWAEALIESLPQALLAMQASGEIVLLNPAAEQLTGWPAGEALGRSVNDVLSLASGGPILDHVMGKAAIPPVEVRDRRGRSITLAVTAADLILPAGASPGIVLVLRDVTEEDAAHRLRSYFLANISHEFRTPLSALKASVELLLEGVDTFTREETLELARSVHFSVTSLQTLVDNLLESVSIEAGKFRIRRRPTDVHQLVVEAEALMKPLLERRNQALIVDLPANLPRLSADPMRLTQVLVNLISNASKYGPVDEPIELMVSIEHGRTLRVSVADRGSGIPADERENIFRRFVRLDERANPQYGIGLGLWVVRTIVQGHGGSVGLDERPGGGTMFWFTLPIEDVQP